VLVAPAVDTDAGLLGQTQTALEALAATTEMSFTSVQALPGDDVSDIALLVALPPDPGLQAWAASHPDAQVVSLGIQGLQPTSNLSILAPEGIRYDQLGFALGYLAAMVTPEYRVGALALDSSAVSLALTRGFVAGGTYYCGLCNPVHPPYIEYPAYSEGVPGDLASGSISTLLIAPPLQSLSELNLPTEPGMALVGVGEPAGELSSRWVASADFDVAAALEAVWTQAQSGQAGTTMPLSIRFHSVDSAIVSEGHLRLAEALLAELAAGVIETGVDPLTGELR
jgi:hypothetical protein